MEIVIILLLLLLNGIFAMAEMAVVTARKHRLQQKANDGSKRAQAALELSKNPNRFLSTIQINITLIGILAGAFGGATIAHEVATYINLIPPLSPYSEFLSLALVVLVITYLSLVIGELVPKRIAMSNPEAIAAMVARPMNFVSMITAPLVYVLSISTDFLLAILGVKSSEPAVSEEEVRFLVREGARVGVFGIAEKDIVERTLALGDRKVSSFMTVRNEIVWLDIDSSFKSLRSKIAKKPHSHFPVCRDTLDKVVGVVRTKDLLDTLLIEEKIDVKKVLHKALFIPQITDALKVLELFKKSGIHMALILDEYGSIQGLISLTDIIEAIVGDIPSFEEISEKEIAQREDGSWLIDGLIPIEEFKEHFHIKKLPGEKSGNYYTLGGFAVYNLNHIPVSGDSFDLENFHFEIIDMDENRIDKILLTSKSISS